MSLGGLLSGLRRRREMRRVFGEIYAARAWGGDESVSGPGSSRARAAAFLDEVIALARSLRVRTLLDAPCGDFNWAAPLAEAVDRYIGIDIVPELIRENRRRFGSPRREFHCRDLVRERLPAADLVLCRDALVHLSTADACAAIRNLRRSGSRFLLATTFVGERPNEEIRTGGWRPLNLERSPFGLPPPLRLIDERCSHSGGIYGDKRLGLWSIADVPAYEGRTAPRPG